MNTINLVQNNSIQDKIKPKQTNSTSNIKKLNLFQNNLQNNDIYSAKHLSHVNLNVSQVNNSQNNYIANSVQNKNLMRRITKDECSANNDSFQQLKEETYNLPYNKNNNKEITLDHLRYGNNSFISSMPQTSNSQQINRPLFSKLENLSINAQAERRTRQNNNLNKNISDSYSAFQSFSNNNLSQINSKQIFEMSFESSHLNSDLKLVSEDKYEINSSYNNPIKTIKASIISPTSDTSSMRNKQLLNSNKSPLLSSSNTKYKIRPFTQYACITLTDNNTNNKNNLSTASIDISHTNNKSNKTSIKTISLCSQTPNNHIRNRTSEVKGSNRSLSNSKVVQVETSMELKQNIKFDRKKLFSMSIRPLGFILSMLSQEDFLKVFYINSSFKKKILEMLILNIKIIINDFKTAYRRMLRLDNCILEINRQKEIKINVILLFSLFNEKLNETSVAIGYSSKYLCDKESYKNNFRFDVRGKGPLSFWVMREYTNVSFKYNL
jgi:hypothetical protein